MNKEFELFKNIKKNWIPFFANQREKPYFLNLLKVLAEQYENYECYPPWQKIFYLFTLIEPKDIKVVIIGQDPYINKEQANGIAFSVTNNVIAPPSLKNIFSELKNDLNIDHFNNNDLSKWVLQGVFLMNTIWSVQTHISKSHANIGWLQFSINLINYINQIVKPLYVLWGKDAQHFLPLVNKYNCSSIISSHPSPFSYQYFKNTKPFSKINEYLKNNNLTPIDWSK